MPKPASAMFRSISSPELRIVIKPTVDQFFPGVGLRVDRTTGEDVQFHNYLFMADGKKLIDVLTGHSRFELDFIPDPLDPTGYWKETGYFEEKSKTYLTPAKRQEQIMAEAQKQVGPIVTSVRTSDNVGNSVKGK